MPEPHSLFGSRQRLSLGEGREREYYSLPQLERAGVGPISRLPVSIRVVLESVLRNYDGRRITEADVRALAAWQPTAPRTAEVPFIVARIVLQDFTGVPLLVDLAAMRSAVARLGANPALIEPLVPVDLVIDHSIQVDYFATPDALQRNMELEFRRNEARYQFLKWGMQAFQGFSVVPPGIGIVHQVNLEYLARGILEREGVVFPDTLVGTDSHTTMINGLGVVGWGVGGIEAEAGMLGQPVYFLMPDVVGVHLTGSLRPGVTATDLVLTLTELLRRERVVGTFVEYHGEGAASLSLTDRATIANMAPEYGATMGYFPVDEETCRYLLATGRPAVHVNAVRAYYQAQGLFGMPAAGQLEYSRLLELDLATVEPSLAGPRRPQDRIALREVKQRFLEMLSRPVSESGYGRQPGLAFPVLNSVTPPAPAGAPPATPLRELSLRDGDVVIAAITSCTNTSNPSVMLGAGILARKAVERGLRVPPTVKTSLAPGSRVVSDYLQRTGLQPYLDQLGFQLVGYGCTTCIGNSGPLDPAIEQTITGNNLVVASVLSGNRNFEARIHQNVRANFLMSPPLVVAYALAGRVDLDLEREPLGTGADGQPVFLRDVWPTPAELAAALRQADDPDAYRRLYADLAEQNPLWSAIPSPTGTVYQWDPASTYIQEPPFFEEFSLQPGAITDVRGARALAILGDSVTTDHISPAGAIRPDSPAGRYLREHGVEPAEFNSYGARRGNDRVMTRGTFANVRLRNRMVPGVEGGYTAFQPGGEQLPIYDAAMRYREAGVPLVVFAGHEYGTGSSRDWAAKGSRLLGVRAVIAQSYERIHRSNLVGMGVLPCQFPEGVSAESLGLDGTEIFDVLGVEGDELRPLQPLTLVIHRASGAIERQPITLRIDTPVEVEYYRHGGILPCVLRQLLGR